MANRHSGHEPGPHLHCVWSVSDILVASRILFRYFSRFLKRLAGRSKTDIDNLILAAIEHPLEFAFMNIGLYISGQVVSLSSTLEVVFGQIIRSLIAFTLFWAIFRILDPLSILLDRTITLFGSPSMHETIKICLPD